MDNSVDALHGYYFEELALGMEASLAKRFGEADLAAYAKLSLDDNPLHMNEAFAARTRTAGRVLHGMLTASLISAIIGTRLPGPGCLWMSQELRFLVSVRIGEEVIATARVEQLEVDRQRARLSTHCVVGARTVLDGQALVWVPSRTRPA